MYVHTHKYLEKALNICEKTKKINTIPTSVSRLLRRSLDPMPSRVRISYHQSGLEIFSWESSLGGSAVRLPMSARTLISLGLVRIAGMC